MDIKECGLNCVAVSEYFSSAHECEQNSQQRCKILSNTVDKLEFLLENAKGESTAKRKVNFGVFGTTRYSWKVHGEVG